MITVNNLSKRYKKNKSIILNNISIEFPKIGLVALTGKSGSGKTTLLNILSGMIDYDSGEIIYSELSDKPIKGYEWDYIRKNVIGYVFQNYNLIQDNTVYQNVSESLRIIGVVDEKIVEEKVDSILKNLGLIQYKNKKVFHLSGGQQQRVSIARALVKNPKIVIADEPTGNLDSETSIEVMKILHEISRTRLVIMVTHDFNFAEIYSDRIVELQNGHLVSDETNIPRDSYYIEDPRTIYLKDYKENIVPISIYSDNIDFDKTNIKLIYKNNTLYIDVPKSYKKVEILDKDKTKILDEHYVAKDKSYLLETNFDSSDLITETEKVAGKNWFKSKLYYLKDMLRLFSSRHIIKKLFLILGLMLGLSVGIITNFGENRENLVDEQYGYISATKRGYDETLYNEIKELKPYIDQEGILSIKIRIPNITQSNYGYMLDTRLGLIDHINSKDIIYGRYPDTKYQVVIDEKVYIESNKRESLTKYGIFSARDLLGEKINANGIVLEIVGISNTKSQRLFINETIKSLLVFTNSSNRVTLAYEDIKDEIEIINGREPKFSNTNVLEIILPATDEELKNKNMINEKYEGFNVVGIYKKKSNSPLKNYNIIGTRNLYESEKLKYYSGEVRFYFEDTNKGIETIEKTKLIQPFHNFTSSVEDAKLASKRLIPILICALLVIVTYIVLFYYTSKARVKTLRPYVYTRRSIGVARKEIVVSYSIANIILSINTVLIGYLIFCFAGSILQSNIGDLSIVYYSGKWVVLFMFLFILIVPIFVGILPFISLLKKSPNAISNN